MPTDLLQNETCSPVAIIMATMPRAANPTYITTSLGGGLGGVGGGGFGVVGGGGGGALNVIPVSADLSFRNTVIFSLVEG